MTKQANHLTANDINTALVASTRSLDAPRRYTGLHAELSGLVIGAAIEVHRHIGPGQLESVYQRALARELDAQQIPFHALAPIVTEYKGEPVGEFVADFIVDDKIIVELKAVAKTLPVHVSQVLSYLRSTHLQLGLLINFNVAVLYRGVTRVIR